jgi:DinB family protein
MTRQASGRPRDGEFAPYAKPDLDAVAGDDAVKALRATAAETVALLSSLDESFVAGRTYAPGKWTLKQVIGHLVDDERIFAYRALCIARGDARPLPGFDENEYMAATDFESRPLQSLIDEFRVVRAATIALLEPLTAEEWVRRGVVNGYEASVRGLAFHIAGHELHHLRILRERYLLAAS